MELDDELCLCFHVTKRKVVNFIRIHRPKVASQISQCGGAGTGCGWCRPFLKKLFQSAVNEEADPLPDREHYSSARQAYIDSGKGTPPG